MWQSDFEYYAALTTPEGDALASARLEIDWVPALRWAEFERGLNAAGRADGSAPSARPVIEPKWSRASGRPYVDGVVIAATGAAPVEFPLSYLAGAVTAAATRLVESGVLVNGQCFEYEVYALAETRARATMPAAGAVALAAEPPVERVELAPLLARAAARPVHGSAHPDTVRRNAADTSGGNAPAAPRPRNGGPMPILIPARVLEEATTLAAQARDLETGGILVGRLCRDADGTLFSRVTAQIPAEHTQATRDSLRFTPRTWAGIEAAITLRNRGEITLGWWHNHPFFCARCTPAQRAVCPFSAPVFSRDDRHLHREVFQQPWSIALLLSFLGEPAPRYDVFAWNRGEITPVEFVTLPPEPRAAQEPCKENIA